MIDKIVISQDGTTITLFYTNRAPFELYHSGGLVLDLLAQFMLPIGVNHEITMASLTASLDDTSIIELKDVA